MPIYDCLLYVVKFNYFVHTYLQVSSFHHLIPFFISTFVSSVNVIFLLSYSTIYLFHPTTYSSRLFVFSFVHKFFCQVSIHCQSSSSSLHWSISVVCTITPTISFIQERYPANNCTFRWSIFLVSVINVILLKTKGHETT